MIEENVTDRSKNFVLCGIANLIGIVSCFTHIFSFLGSVLRIDWSPDGCVLALSWAGGGLSIWSVFGACLMCTLASDRAYKVDGSPVMQGIFKSMVRFES